MNCTPIGNKIGTYGFNFKCKIYSSMYTIYKEKLSLDFGEYLREEKKTLTFKV